MSEIGIGGQYHSISSEGMAIFENGISTTIGGIVVDLASAPIDPGEHDLTISAGIGGIEIYLPKYVKFTIEGETAVGGHDVHEGLGLWDKLTNRVKGALHLPSKIPDHAVENPDPSKPISVRFLIDSTVGGIDIYRI